MRNLRCVDALNYLATTHVFHCGGEQKQTAESDFVAFLRHLRARIRRESPSVSFKLRVSVSTKHEFHPLGKTERPGVQHRASDGNRQ